MVTMHAQDLPPVDCQAIRREDSTCATRLHNLHPDGYPVPTTGPADTHLVLKIENTAWEVNRALQVHMGRARKCLFVLQGNNIVLTWHLSKE